MGVAPVKITERSYIQAPPEKVWPYLITPEHFQEWNDKIVSMEARGTFVLNQPFVTHYRLGKQSSQCLSTVVAIEPLRLARRELTRPLQFIEHPLR